MEQKQSENKRAAEKVRTHHCEIQLQGAEESFLWYRQGLCHSAGSDRYIGLVVTFAPV